MLVTELRAHNTFDQPQRGNIMTKHLSALLAATFAVASLTTVVFAQSPDAVAEACKGKKPGDEVIVDGKTVKCPAPKK
jgi:hypothetical protein